MKDLTQQAVSGAQGLQRQDVQSIATGLAPEVLLAKQSPIALIAEVAELITGEEFALQPEQRFPSGFAVVYVEEKNNGYVVRAHHSIQQTLHTEPSSPPQLGFDAQMAKRNPSEIRGIVREFSQKNAEAKKIRGWLVKLKKLLQEQFAQDLECVVIHDRTDFEIPWEMLNLSQNEHLGSSVVTVRWQDIQALEAGWDDSEQPTPLDIQAGNCQGDIIAYANTKDFEGVKDEINLLNDYNAQCIEDVQEFLKRLHQKIKKPVGLVFVASHGFLSEDVFDVALGEADKQHRVSLSELCGWDFEFLRIDRSIVFMNACHSGRLRRDSQFTGQRMGLATFFLERGAGGVIGTMGKIEDRYAPKIAQHFLEEYQNTPNQSVAGILRRMREQALKNIQTDPCEENWALFLFTFMYVYYGNPMTVLRLSASGGQSYV
jgi:CHAT domain-containing protein